MGGWVTRVGRGETVREGDLLGSDFTPVSILTPVAIDGVDHCASPPRRAPTGRCGCHAPGARLTQLPRSLASGPDGQRVMVLHHLDYKITSYVK